MSRQPDITRAPLQALSRLVITAPECTATDLLAILMLLDDNEQVTWGRIRSRLRLNSTSALAQIQRLRGFRFRDCSHADDLGLPPEPVFSAIDITEPRQGVASTASFVFSTPFNDWLHRHHTGFTVDLPDAEMLHLGIDALALYLRWAAMQHQRSQGLEGLWAHSLGWRYRGLNRFGKSTSFSLPREWIDFGFLARVTIREVQEDLQTRVDRIGYRKRRLTGFGKRHKWSPARIRQSFETVERDLKSINVDFAWVESDDRYNIRIIDDRKGHFAWRLRFDGRPVSEAFPTEKDLNLKLRQRRRQIDDFALDLAREDAERAEQAAHDAAREIREQALLTEDLAHVAGSISEPPPSSSSAIEAFRAQYHAALNAPPIPVDDTSAREEI